MKNESCDICLGKGTTLKGDECICGDGTLQGLARGLRQQLVGMTREFDKMHNEVLRRGELLVEVRNWILRRNFDGHGKTLADRISWMLDA